MAKAIIFDTGLLVLLVVGSASRSFITRHKRTSQFSADDFDLLSGLLARCEVFVTPNTLTETSNLVRQVSEPARSAIGATFAALIEAAEEIYVPSRHASGHPAFARLGLADSAQLRAVSGRMLLTVDLGLYLSALAAGEAAENFNHLRDNRSS
jgi:hypothetical protein